MFVKAKLGTYGMAQACKLSGLPPHTIQNWTHSGLIQPSLNLGPGRGHGKRWSVRDLIGLRTIAALRDNGVSLQKVRRLAAVLAEIKGTKRTLDAIAQSRLVVMPDQTVSLQTREQLMNLLTGQHVMGSIVMIDLHPVVHEITERVEAFEAIRRKRAA